MGMNVARINFSHQDQVYHTKLIENFRKALANCPENQCALMLDTKGPEIRVGSFKKNDKGQPSITLETDKTVIVTGEKVEGSAGLIPIDYPDLATTVRPDDQILIADAAFTLVVEKINPDWKSVTCRVENGGVLLQNKNVHLVGRRPALPTVSQKDVQDIQWGVKMGFDMISASFMSHASDVETIRDILGEKGKEMKIFAKITTEEGMRNYDEILKVSDGVMIARGDLGASLPIQTLFAAQKMMISKANAVSKPVITATEMLHSMMVNPRPTRAEATDVANAVLDGVDCVMLCSESATGKYPIESFEYMHRICIMAERVEQTEDHSQSTFEILKERDLLQPFFLGNSTPDVIASYAVRTARDLNAKLLIVVTQTGRTARVISKYHPSVLIFAATNQVSTAKSLLVQRSAVPVLFKDLSKNQIEQFIEESMKKTKEIGLTKSGDLVVVVNGLSESTGQTNRITVLTIK